MQLQDGYSTIIQFDINPAVKLWEKTVTPPGGDGGPSVDTKTMRNVLWATKAPQTLIEVTDSKFKAAYDPEVLLDLIAMINQVGSMTIWFPDGSAWTDYGYLKSFKPDEIKMGEQPTAECEIVFTQQDGVTLDAFGAPVEVGPVFTPAP